LALTAAVVMTLDPLSGFRLDAGLACLGSVCHRLLTTAEVIRKIGVVN
jgi:hypothetical protein